VSFQINGRSGFGVFIDIKIFLKIIINTMLKFLTRKQQIVAIVFAGIIGGLLVYSGYAFRVTSYLGDDPATCMNCHVMTPYYATWAHSAHANNATCTDCHLPHDNFASYWVRKGQDGLRHTWAFLTSDEHDVIRAIDSSKRVAMQNCFRCHGELNTEFVYRGRQVTYEETQRGNHKACWDCHRETPHGVNSAASTPDALVPHPPAVAPEWLRNLMQK
jgi:cytochrome c nitrite reductase small subunit